MKAILKKVLSFALVIALTAGVAIGGTLAYLTQDAGEETNVFSVGNIDISLDEEVGIYGEGGEAKKTEDGAEYTDIMPGDYLKKEVTVTNEGKTPAYVAVTVDVNNFKQIQKVIEAYGEDDENAEKMLDFVFDGWGLTVKDRYVDGKKDMSYKVNELVDSHILHVDSAKRIVANEVAHFSINNWFKSDAEKAASGYTVAGVGKSYYAGDMEDYSLRFTYYLYLDAGEKATLFKGLNVPAEFTNEQMAMFDGLEINVEAKAIQADNMGIAAQYAGDENGKAKTAFAVLAGDIEAKDLGVDNTPVTRETSNEATLKNAIKEAKAGDVIVLTKSITVDGYAATEKLIIDKAITLDLNGFTLTTECGWGGIDAKNGCTIKNGTINHTGNTAAIKAFQVESIENVTINVTQTEGKVKGGIVVQEGSGCYVGSIENVTITGATNGIETYRCGSRNDLAIGSMENVIIDATDTGILLSAPIGKVINCDIEGDNIGVNMYLYGAYSVSMELVDSDVSGATGIYAHDEVGKTNPGSLSLTVDTASTIKGGIVKEFEAEVKDRVDINTPAVQVSSAENLTAALAAGENVVLAESITAEAEANSGYGNAGVVVENGAVLDGNGETLNITDANGTWDCAVNLTGGTVKNLTITGGFRGIFVSGGTDDIVIDNCVLDKVCYTFNSDDGSKDYSVTIKNTTLNGWTSYSDVHKSVDFINCKFGKGTGSYEYAFCRPYNASTFTECVFEEGFEFDTTKASSITFVNCYYGDTLITAENAETLAGNGNTFFYNGVGSVTFE